MLAIYSEKMSKNILPHPNTIHYIFLFDENGNYVGKRKWTEREYYEKIKHFLNIRVEEVTKKEYEEKK
jgi:hypothetical protein